MIKLGGKVGYFFQENLDEMAIGQTNPTLEKPPTAKYFALYKSHSRKSKSNVPMCASKRFHER